MRILLTVGMIFMGCSLSGCAQMLVHHFMEGPSPCLATEVNKSVETSRKLNFVRSGQVESLITSIRFLGEPDSRNIVELRDGAEVHVLFYRVGLPQACAGSSKFKRQFEPIFVENGHVVGLGYDYYREEIAPYVMQLSQNRVQPADYRY